jgi:hypothetical protein
VERSGTVGARKNELSLGLRVAPKNLYSWSRVRAGLLSKISFILLIIGLKGYSITLGLFNSYDNIL